MGSGAECPWYLLLPSETGSGGYRMKRSLSCSCSVTSSFTDLGLAGVRASAQVELPTGWRTCRGRALSRKPHLGQPPFSFTAPSWSQQCTPCQEQWLSWRAEAGEGWAFPISEESVLGEGLSC